MLVSAMLLAALVISGAFFLQAAAAPSIQPGPPQPQETAPQVATGASASSATPMALRQLLADHDWLALEDTLAKTQDPDVAFYRGILLNRLGKYPESIRLLEPLLPAIAAGPDRTREKQARLALGNDYLRAFQYRKAAAQYAALEQCCTASLTASERDEIEVPAKLLPSLENAPPQTLETKGSFTVPMDRNTLGLRDIAVWVDGYPAKWLFDPAANFTLLSRSQARRIGLKLSEQAVPVTGITGAKIQVHASIIPQLKFGHAFFRNVPAMVCDDRDLYDAAHRYQIEGILAQPLLAPLGMVTASDDEHLTISDGPELTMGVPFFRDGNYLAVAAGGKPNQQAYIVDPAATSSLLTSRYYEAHPRDFAGVSTQPIYLPDTDTTAPAYPAENIELDFAGAPITLREIPVLANPSDAERDRFWGVLGEDALDQLQSYTFDFRSMRFLIRTH